MNYKIILTKERMDELVISAKRLADIQGKIYETHKELLNPNEENNTIILSRIEQLSLMEIMILLETIIQVDNIFLLEKLRFFCKLNIDRFFYLSVTHGSHRCKKMLLKYINCPINNTTLFLTR